MDDARYNEALDELDHLMNDPDVPLEPTRVWDLLAEVSHHDIHHAH
ncbi:peptide chain release factor 1 [Rhizosaccharibacter radicis]|uniref:Peptide chain release factor 1 n=1 Tax=Rhizosaccharibacter radicis TaxID=2782605 RepID=A0ABT1VTM0_9PROT|nr:peptide chain release factor 1 [Acetobacteraceae bacterium KSS12]